MWSQPTFEDKEVSFFFMVNGISRSRAGMTPWIIKSEDLQSIPFSGKKACACVLTSIGCGKQKCELAQSYTIGKNFFPVSLSGILNSLDWEVLWVNKGQWETES